MWLLQENILIRILVGCLVFSIASFVLTKIKTKGKITPFILIFDLALLFYISKSLFVFYLIYSLITFLFTRMVITEKTFKTFLFPVLCIFCVAPFLLLRYDGDILGAGFVAVGIGYNMLKAIDGIYYSYYAQVKIPIITWLNYMLFIPVFTAGPIMRYRDFSKSYEHPEKILSENTEKNIKRLILGLFKKVVLFKFAGDIFAYIYSIENHGVLWGVTLIVVNYALLYLDMSGYADMAIALGAFFGIKVPENFKNPLKAASLTQMWRNFHITLSDWIREHIFIVLNGKKLGKISAALVAFSTMMIMCFWHGSTKLMLWDGLFTGTWLAMENLLGLTTADKKNHKAIYVLRCVITNFLFAVPVLCYTCTEAQIIEIIKSLFSMF